MQGMLPVAWLRAHSSLIDAINTQWKHAEKTLGAVFYDHKID
jgi:hypothetical protein